MDLADSLLVPASVQNHRVGFANVERHRRCKRILLFAGSGHMDQLELESCALFLMQQDLKRRKESLGGKRGRGREREREKESRREGREEEEGEEVVGAGSQATLHPQK